MSAETGGTGNGRKAKRKKYKKPEGRENETDGEKRSFHFREGGCKAGLTGEYD